MKNKLLVFALAAALAAVSVVPSVFAQSASTTTLTITEVAPTMTIGSSLSTIAFTSITPYLSRSSQARFLATGVGQTKYRIQVVDLNGDQSGTTKDGHKIRVYAGANSWVYNKTDVATTLGTRVGYHGTVANDTTTVNRMKFQFGLNGTQSGNGAYYKTWSAYNSQCTTQGNWNGSKIAVTAVQTQNVFRNTTTCAGTSSYFPTSIKIVAPLNGLGIGTYTLSGSIALSDGQ